MPEHSPPQAPAPAADVIARLHELSEKLTPMGFTALMETPEGRQPSLFVSNPAGGPKMSERVYAQTRDDGRWWFWWSWAEPISADLDDTAATIGRVLRLGTG